MTPCSLLVTCSTSPTILHCWNMDSGISHSHVKLIFCTILVSTRDIFKQMWLSFAIRSQPKGRAGFSVGAAQCRRGTDGGACPGMFSLNGARPTPIVRQGRSDPLTHQLPGLAWQLCGPEEQSTQSCQLIQSCRPGDTEKEVPDFPSQAPCFHFPQTACKVQKGRKIC